MIWWLNTDFQAFSVDNSLVYGGMDFSSLTPDVWMIQWREGRGEIERQDSNSDNLNGLRERFYDLVPYVPLFQQFMRLLPGLTLVQAQQIQVELVEELFLSKRTALFPYTVAAGSFNWDTDDPTLTALAIAALPGTATVQWLPSGATVAVSLARAEVNGMMSGMAARRLGLHTTQNIKINEINNLTTVDATINYDVTAGW